MYSFWFLTKETPDQDISSLLLSEKRNVNHRAIKFQNPIRAEFSVKKSEKSVFRKYISSHMLRPNKRTRLVIENRKFTLVLTLTVFLVGSCQQNSSIADSDKTGYKKAWKKHGWFNWFCWFPHQIFLLGTALGEFLSQVLWSFNQFSRSYEVTKFCIWRTWRHTLGCTKHSSPGFLCMFLNDETASRRKWTAQVTSSTWININKPLVVTYK